MVDSYTSTDKASESATDLLPDAEYNQERKHKCQKMPCCRPWDLLKTSETIPLLQWVTGLMPVVVWAVDVDGVFQLSEGKALEGLGLKPGEVVGTSAFDLYAGFPAVISAMRRMLDGEQFVDEMTVNGRYFEVNFMPVRDVEGAVSGGVGISLEVTRRRHAELKTVEQERLFETIFSSLPQALVLATPERTILRVNPAAEALFGYVCEELHGVSTSVLYADEELFEEVGKINSVSSEPVTLDMKCKRKDGSTFISESVCSKLVDKHGIVRWLVGMHCDVTEKRQARALIQWHGETLQMMMDASPAMALLIGRDSRILLANSKFAKHVQVPLERLIGSGLAEICCNKDICKNRMELISRVFETGKSASFVDSCRSGWFEHHLSPFPGPDGSCLKVAIYIFDISDRVRREEEDREQIARELHDVVSEMLEKDSGEHFTRDHLHGKPLTPRELDVLKEIASGLSTKMIAHKHDVSTKTIESQRLSIMRKLRLFNVVELTKYALRNGLITLDGEID